MQKSKEFLSRLKNRVARKRHPINNNMRVCRDTVDPGGFFLPLRPQSSAKRSLLLAEKKRGRGKVTFQQLWRWWRRKVQDMQEVCKRRHVFAYDSCERRE
eukprot:c15107_g1_i1 orf=147-446(+)